MAKRPTLKVVFPITSKIMSVKKSFTDLFTYQIEMLKKSSFNYIYDPIYNLLN